MRRGTGMHQENQAALAALDQRVLAVERDVKEIKLDLSNGLAQIQSKLDDRARPQWQALSVVLAFCVAVGGLAYWPIREAQTDIKLAIKDVRLEFRERERELWAQILETRSRLDRLDGRLSRSP